MSGSAKGESRLAPPPSEAQVFFSDPAVDRLASAVLRLTEEVWVLNERLAAFEAIASRRDVIAAGEMESFQFSGEEDGKIRSARGQFIRRVLGPLAAVGRPNKI